MKHYSQFIFKIIVMTFCIPYFGWAQEATKGIQFEKKLNWESVLKKARKEKKYVFVDCYATWCAPCKEMDRTVFVNDTISDFVSKNFISVKVQMDSTATDPENVRAYYPVAKSFTEKYKISSIPTYLFFASDGSLVEEGIGKKNTANFLKLINDATDPSKQLIPLIKQKVEKWRAGKLDYLDMSELIDQVKTKLRDGELSKKIGSDYVQNYLYKLSTDELLSSAILKFMIRHENLVNINDRFYRLCLEQPELIDDKMNTKGFTKKSFARDVVKDVVHSTLIVPEMNDLKRQNAAQENQKAVDFDWFLMRSKIKAVVPDDYTDEIISTAKFIWYGENLNKWPNEFANEVISNFGKDDLYVDRNEFKANQFGDLIEYYVLPYCTDTALLKRATDIMSTVVKVLPDTYLFALAGLLYKIGKPISATRWQAIEIRNISWWSLNNNKGLPTKEFYKWQETVLEKMKKKEPIDKWWTTESHPPEKN